MNIRKLFKQDVSIILLYIGQSFVILIKRVNEGSPMASSNIALSVGFQAFLTGVITVYYSILLLLRYKKKPQKATLYVTFANLSWGIMFLLASFVYLFAGINLDLGQAIQVIMYSCVFSALIFIYMFARKAFFKGNSGFYVFYTILGIFLSVLLWFGSSYVEPFPDSMGGNYPAIILKTEYGLVLVAYVVPTLIGVVISAFRVASRLGDKLFSRGFQVIGLGIIIALVAMVCDTVATLVITDVIGYALALYAQWICNLLASICLYVGWTMPGWFQRMYGIRKGINKSKNN